MSGIAAIFHRDGRPVDRQHLQRIAQSLTIYGPEKQIVQADQNVAFVYTHFTNTPEARGAYQPLKSQSGRYTFLFDGRIDNREDLARDLNISATQLRMMSDAALALASWEKSGMSALNCWVGEFAAIIWNDQTREFTLLRDQFGRRPLHYHLTDDRLVIASMPKGIHALGDIERRLNPDRLIDVLSYIDTDLTLSYFEQIDMVAPAHCTIVSADCVRHTRYYRLDDHRKPVRYKRDEDYVEAADALFDTAIKACLRSPGPVGSFLSSGLDSSTAAAYAADHLAQAGRRLSTYTWVPMSGFADSDDPSKCFDESPAAYAMAETYPNIDVNLIGRDGPGLFDGLDAYLLAAESVVRNGLNLALMNATGRAARQDGIKVMLEGTAGNSTLSYNGADLHYNMLRSGRLDKLFIDLARSPNPVPELKALIRKTLPEPVFDLVERLRGKTETYNSNARRNSAANEGAALHRQTRERGRALGFSYSHYPIRGERDYWVRFIENYMGPADANMRAAMPALYGFELRDPFFDRRILEWHFGVPEAQYNRRGESRYLMKRMTKNRLPDLIRDRQLGKGRQSADWRPRLQRDQERLINELDISLRQKEFEDVPNTPRLKALIQTLDDPEKTSDPDKLPEYVVVLPLAISVARLVNYEAGSNF